MVENGAHENQEMSHVMRQYCTGSAHEGQNGNSSDNNHLLHNDKYKHEGHKHSYFLRAKTPRFVGYRAIDEEDGELLKKPSSSSSSLFDRFGSKSEEYCPSASSEDEDLANCLVMLSNKSNQENYVLCKTDHNNKEQNKVAAKQVVEKGMFQCKACKKVFNSHQALGGHRASHKKVKGCFAAKLDGPHDEENPDDDSTREDREPITPLELDGAHHMTFNTSNPRRAKMHECSVCRRVFSSGQALGGHKRCHWLTNSSDCAFIPSFHDFRYDRQSQEICKKKPMFVKPNHNHLDHNLDTDHDHDHDHQLDLNLNLPAPHVLENRDDDDDNMNKSRFDALHDVQQLAKQNQQKVEVEKNGEKRCEKELRKLRDMNMDGGWLQMGIHSTTDIC